jgi:hypothetical protein
VFIPEALRYRLLHLPAKLTTHARHQETRRTRSDTRQAAATRRVIARSAPVRTARRCSRGGAVLPRSHAAWGPRHDALAVCRDAPPVVPTVSMATVGYRSGASRSDCRSDHATVCAALITESLMRVAFVA